MCSSTIFHGFWTSQVLTRHHIGYIQSGPPKLQWQPDLTEREPKVEQGKIREVRKYRNAKRLFVQSWTEHKVTITRMNMIKVMTATAIMIAMMGWQGMTRTWLWCLWFWMLMDVDNVLLRRIQGLIASSLKSCWSLEPHLHLPVAESYTCKWNLLLCFGWCGTVVMLILTKWFWNWSE